MSEEEIIGRLKRIIKIAYSKEFTTFELTYQDVDAIQGLLDLYNKQKEEIEDYKSGYFFTAKQMHIIDKDYISKDKIRDILLKFQNKYSPYLETTDRLFIGKEVVQYSEDILDEMAKELDIELLEEE